MKQLLLIKGIHKFYYTYEEGDENSLVTVLIEHVNRGLIDQFDASIMCSQIGVSFQEELKKHSEEE